MNTKSLLLVSLLAAANLAFAGQVDTGSPLTTTASALHDVQADVASVAAAHGNVVATPAVPVALAVPARAVNTLSPITTSQAALHDTAANAQSTANVQQLHLERQAARSYATR